MYPDEMAHTGSQWTFVLAVTAIFLSVVVTLQILSSYAKASIAAPAEILTFIEAVDSSVEENESYDRDVLRVQRLDDKLRLGRLLREIQRGGDDLREELNGLLMSESGDLTTDGYSDLRDLRLRATARLLWASKRSQYKSSTMVPCPSRFGLFPECMTAGFTQGFELTQTKKTSRTKYAG